MDEMKQAARLELNRLMTTESPDYERIATRARQIKAPDICKVATRKAADIEMLNRAS